MHAVVSAFQRTSFIFCLILNPFTLKRMKMTIKGVPLTRDNITFRKLADNPNNKNSDDEVIVNGGGIGQVQNRYEESSANGYFWLINGITASISNLPQGNYKIIETYSEEHITNVVVPDPNTSGKEGLNTVANISVGPNGTVSTEFVNRLFTCELKITKKVEGKDPTEELFPVRVTFTGPGVNGIKCESGFTETSEGSGVWTGTLAHGTSVTFTDIPKNTKYEIDEPGLHYDYENTTGSALKGTLTTSITEDDGIVLKNTYSHSTPLQLSALKKFSGAGPIDYSFNFALYPADADGRSTSTTPLSEKSIINKTLDDALIDFDEIGIKAEGVSYYLIKEVSASSDVWAVDSTQYHIKVTATPSSLPVGPLTNYDFNMQKSCQRRRSERFIRVDSIV